MPVPNIVTLYICEYCNKQFKLKNTTAKYFSEKYETAAYKKEKHKLYGIAFFPIRI
jgi:hypothetical protein